MRLTCPNCNAQYEVDDTVIPEDGRDVQCSACGHTWYQYPASVALRMRAADIDDDEDDDASGLPPPEAAQAAAPRIDRTVLDVLREEAEREIGERRRSRAALEMQGDLGLDAPRPRRVTPAAAEGKAEDGRGAPPASRRNLLPDIEELSSTLEPGSEPRRGTGETGSPGREAQERRGFRRGFAVVVLVGIALAALYLLAPVIAAQAPALGEPLARYVALIDGMRAEIARLLRDLLGRAG